MDFLRTPPKLGAIRKLLMKLSVEAFEDALQGWVEQLLPGPVNDAALPTVVMDSKSLCGALHGFDRAINLLSLLGQATGDTLRELKVGGKTNEHKAALELLKSLVLEGKVITRDAMFHQLDLCRQIVDDDGHYRLEVKGNQSELKAAIKVEFQPAFLSTRSYNARRSFRPRRP